MTRLIIGAMVRAIGAYPSGWRYPGAHRDPRGDAAVLRHAARGRRGGAARLPLLRRLAGDRATTSSSATRTSWHASTRCRRSPTSRASPSTSGSSRPRTPVTPIPIRSPAPPRRSTCSRAAAPGSTSPPVPSHAPPATTGGLPRRQRIALRAGRRVRPGAAAPVGLVRRRCDRGGCRIRQCSSTRRSCTPPTSAAEFLSVDGPLNVPRPVQGHLPIVHAGTSPRSRLFAARTPTSPSSPSSDLEHAAAIREELRALAFESGRDDRTLKVIAPVLPIIGETREHAQSIADELRSSCRSPRTGPTARPPAFPANRSLAQLSPLVGVDVSGLSPDRAVTPALARRVQCRRAGARRDRRRAHRPQPVGRAAADAAAPRRRGIRERVDDRRHGRRRSPRSSRLGRRWGRRRLQRALGGAARAVRRVRPRGRARAAAARRVRTSRGGRCAITSGPAVPDNVHVTRDDASLQPRDRS